MTLHLRQLLPIALILMSGCSERLTPVRAGTIIRHSKAFLSGAPESQPVFDRVDRIDAGPTGSTAGGGGGDSCVVEFSYHWRPQAGVADFREEQKARVALGRAGGSWTVDDERTRALFPSWPQLPKSPNDLGTPGSDAGHGKSPKDSKEIR